MTRVLIVAFDGLQPSQVRPELAPNLAAFAAGGVTYTRNHPVFPTVTRINVASLVTGRHPGSHGLAGNTLVFRDYNPNITLPAMEPQLAQVAEQTGRVLLAPTLADILHDHGKEYVAVGVGTSGNAYVQNPRAETSAGPRSTRSSACRGDYMTSLSSALARGQPMNCRTLRRWSTGRGC